MDIREKCFEEKKSILGWESPLDFNEDDEDVA